MVFRRNHLRRSLAKLLVLGTAALLSVVGLEAALRWLHLADPPAFEENPYYGYLMKPNQVVATRGYAFRINRAGLRGENFEPAKAGNVYRVAFLGDSITYGGGAIRDEDLFVNRVASSLSTTLGQPVQGLNISAPGWGIENIAGYVNHAGLFESDLVVWVIPSADFLRPKTTASENDFRTAKPKIRLAYAAKIGWRKTIKWLERNRGRAGSWRNPELLSRNLEIFGDTLTLIAGKATSVVVVFMPGANGYDSSEELAQFQSVAVSRGVAFLDMAPMFHQRKSDEIFLDGVHLSRSGHELVGSSIAAFLKEKLRAPQQKSPAKVSGPGAVE